MIFAQGQRVQSVEVARQGEFLQTVEAMGTPCRRSGLEILGKKCWHQKPPVNTAKNRGRLQVLWPLQTAAP